MVALLVVFTIVACLLADAILLSVRERRAVTAGQAATTPAVHAMVFAQDGGKPVEKDEKVIGEVPWKEIDSEKKNEAR